MLEEKLFDDILKSWDKIPGNSKSEYAPPQKKTLKYFMEAAFVVSLLKEEGQEIETQITLLSQEYVAKRDQNWGWQVVKFSEPKELEPRWLAKISPAINIETTTIAVEETPKGYFAWGLVKFATRELRKFSFVTQGGVVIPNTLTVTSVGPASLLISQGNRSIGRYIRGQYSLLKPSVFTSKSLGKFLLREIEKHEEYMDFGTMYWHYYRDMVEYLLSQTSKRSHGATIIWVPEDQLSHVETIIEKKYSIDEPLDIKNTVRELMTIEKERSDSPFAPILKRDVFDYLDLLAQLACVDGALVITDRFNPISFGTRLNAEQWKSTILFGPDNVNTMLRRTDEVNLYGMRHRSALNFAGSCEGVIAFVLSHDGPIRAFRRWHNDTMFYWPDCTTKVHF